MGFFKRRDNLTPEQKEVRSLLNALNAAQEELDLAHGKRKMEIATTIRTTVDQLKRKGYRVSLGPDGYWGVR